jgi:hypothetical protein
MPIKKEPERDPKKIFKRNQPERKTRPEKGIRERMKKGKIKKTTKKNNQRGTRPKKSVA